MVRAATFKETQLNYGNMKMAMHAETSADRMMMLCTACCCGAIVLVWGALYFARLDTVIRLQADAIENLPDYDEDGGLIYDHCKLEAGYKYTDTAEAAELQKSIQEDCDEECMKGGTGWSVIYALNGAICMAIVLKQIIACFGAFIACFRYLGLCVGCLLCWFYLAAVIVTPVIRFSDQSKLCALNPSPSLYVSWEEERSDTWTFEKDGVLIMSLWIIQLICCCCPLYGGVRC